MAMFNNFLKILKFKHLIVRFFNHFFTCNWTSVISITRRMILDFSSCQIISLKPKQSNGSHSFFSHTATFCLFNSIFSEELAFSFYVRDSLIPEYAFVLEVGGTIHLTNFLVMNWKSSLLLSQVI